VRAMAAAHAMPRGRTPAKMVKKPLTLLVRRTASFAALAPGRGE
jgi:hypothetical protein